MAISRFYLKTTFNAVAELENKNVNRIGKRAISRFYLKTTFNAVVEFENKTVKSPL
jgi:hypothetical protein